MTARQVWEGMLTELSKVNAPSLLLHEFNYYFNKAINLYINKRYNIYDVNQLTTDDLRVLKATAMLTPKLADDYSSFSQYGAGAAGLFAGTYEVNLPDDYLHMLNCVCIYRMAKQHKCYNKGDYVDFPAKRLTADAWSVVINDYYNRPLPERPYYYIHNVNTVDQDGKPVSPTVEGLFSPVHANAWGVNTGIDMNGYYGVTADKSNSDKHSGHELDNEDIRNSLGGTPERVNNTDVSITRTIDGEEVTWIGGNYYKISDLDESGSPTETAKPVKTGELVQTTKTTLSETNPGKTTNFDRVIKVNGYDVSTVERETAYRYGNASKVRCEIRYGRDNSIYQLKNVFIDYIKAPQIIRLTKEQVDLTEDTSQIMEFPDYVCQEIINELTTLIMARDADPRLQVQAQVTLSIANPAQALAPQQQAQARQQLQG